MTRSEYYYGYLALYCGTWLSIVLHGTWQSHIHTELLLASELITLKVNLFTSAFDLTKLSYTFSKANLDIFNLMSASPKPGFVVKLSILGIRSLTSHTLVWILSTGQWKRVGKVMYC